METALGIYRSRWLAVFLFLVSTRALGVEFTIFAAPERYESVIKSDNALAFLDVDIDDRPGWVVNLKGGYQWKYFRKVGFEAGGFSMKDNHTKSGAAASAGLGYNFGPRVPITIGVLAGIGPQGNFNTRGYFNNALYEARQKVRIYTFDLSVDYDFKTRTRWTPFVGVSGGVAFVSDQAKLQVTRDVGPSAEGSYGKKKRVNLVGGFRAGTRFKINERMTLSLYGTYEYLGSVPLRDIGMSDGSAARTSRMQAHAVDLKMGLKIHF